MKSILVLLAAASLAFAQAAPKAPAKPTSPQVKAPAKAEAKPEPKAEAKTAAKPEAKVEAKAGAFIGNKDSKTLHKADCKTAASMKPANKVAFATREEAEKQGFKPCKVCLK